MAMLVLWLAGRAERKARVQLNLPAVRRFWVKMLLDVLAGGVFAVWWDHPFRIVPGGVQRVAFLDDFARRTGLNAPAAANDVAA